MNQHPSREGYPYIKKIYKYMWKKWTHALYRISRTERSITREHLRETKRGEVSGIYRRKRKPVTLEDALDDLKQHLRQVVGKLEYTEKDIEDVATKLISRKEIHSWTDGSMMREENGHGYLILPDGTSHNKSIEGYGRSLRGTINSSLRSEHCGVLSLLIVILTIEKVYGIKQSGSIMIYSDSMTVVQRIGDGAVE